MLSKKNQGIRAAGVAQSATPNRAEASVSTRGRGTRTEAKIAQEMA
jgi:hypothetical protein